MSVRTYTVVNPIPSLVGLMERNFAVLSWDIAHFAGVVPPLNHPTIAAAQSAHENAIALYDLSLGIGDPNANYPTGPFASYPPFIAYPS